MINKVWFFILFISLLTPKYALLQTNKFSGKNAKKLFHRGHFEEALKCYFELDSLNYTSEDYLNIAVSFYNINDRRIEGIPYFLEFFKTNDTLPASHYFIGDMYHESYEFDSAIVHYNIFKKLILKDLENKEIPEDIYLELDETANAKIKNCNFGKVMIDHPRKVIIENLGDSVNSSFNEYAPVISDDEKLLFFTSRRPDENKLSPDGDYYENIYLSELLDGSLFDKDLMNKLHNEGVFFSLQTPLVYTLSKKIKPPYNSDEHDAAVMFDQQENMLYLFRDNHLWRATYSDTSKSEPHKMEDNVNAGNYVPSIVLSTDKKIKFISAERDSGYGGLDIYFSQLQDDSTWSEFKNLGNTINTPQDDDVNYFDSDRNIMYFSSKGHSGMGDFDIFKSTYKNGEWTAPMNMGYPVNTPRTDVFYIMTPRYNRAYYASAKYEGQGGLDLYRLTFADERSSLAEIKGLVLKYDSLIPAYSHITILEDSKPIMEQFSDSLNGDYLLLLAHDREYKMRVETDGFYPYEAELIIPKQLDYFQLYQEIHHVYLYDNEGNVIGQKISMHNSFFEKDQAFNKDSLQELYESGKSVKGYEKLTNVNFYISEDSLSKLVNESDPDLEFNIPENATIQFADTIDNNGKVIFVPIKNKKVLEKQTPIIANQITDKDSLMSAIENKNIDSIPEIIVYFDFNMSAINQSKNLDFFVNYLIRNPQVKVVITGHTDDIGNTDNNFNLGMDRALNTKLYLMQHGVNKNQISKIDSKGELLPIAPNKKPNGDDNPNGRKLNRRVVFDIISN